MNIQEASNKQWCARSDPRMNRALEARLQNPNSSLYECLRLGGFDFASDEANALDSENVTLTQRKNQLNRRLRSYRKRLSKSKSAMSPSVSSQDPEEEQELLQQTLQQTQNNIQDLLAVSEKDHYNHALMNCRRLSLNLFTDMHSEKSLQGQGEAKTGDSLMQMANLVGAHSTASDTLHQASSQELAFSLLSNWEALSGQTMPSFSSRQPMLPQGDSNSGMQAIYSSLPAAIAGGNQAAANAGQSGNSSLSSWDPFHAMHDASGTGGPVPNAVRSGNHPQVMPASALSESIIQLALQQQQQQQQQQQSHRPDPRHELALGVFEQEMQSVYERSMRTAGFGPHETDANSASYQNFLQVASQREYERVQRSLGNHGAGAQPHGNLL